MASLAGPDHPVVEPLPLYLALRQPAERNRLTVGFRIIMLIPQIVVLAVLGIVAAIVAVIGWFAALVLGRLPGFAREFLSGFVRWSTRVQAYGLLLIDEYPPFSLTEEPQYGLQVAIPGATPLNRLAVVVRILIAIPAAVVNSVAGSGASIISIASWFAIVVTGRQPRGLFEAERAALRFQLRFYGYLYMLTAEYPWGLYGDQDAPELTAEEDAAGVDADPWRLRLTASGRGVMTVLVVLGAIWTLLNLRL